MKQGSISAEVKEGKLIITVEPGAGVPSASGKTKVLASTRGAIAVNLPGGGQAQLNVNLYQ